MLETAYHVIKITVAIGLSLVFMVAITALLGLINHIVFDNIIGEIFKLISMYLPFNASPVFATIGLSTLSILYFLVARKIYDLSSWTLSTS